MSQNQRSSQERMIRVDQIRDCKPLHAKGLGVRVIAPALGIPTITVRDYLSGVKTLGQHTMSRDPSQPVGAELRLRVRDLPDSEQELQTPRKQRLTAARIHRLRRAQGLRFSGSSVGRLVREIRQQALFDPLDYEPGEDAQIDNLEGVVDDKTLSRVTVYILLVRARFSVKTFLCAAPNQTREALVEGLMRAFEFFGGISQTLWFDNRTPRVKQVLKGRIREPQRRHLRKTGT